MQKPKLELLAKDYNVFDNSMKDSGYSRFERGVVYTGLGLGMFAPVALTRYFVLPSTDSPVLDVLYWAASIGINVLSTTGLRGFPMVYSGGAGASVGILGAFTLKKLRERRRERRVKRK